MESGLPREKILEALKRLSDCLKRDGIQGEICLLGGTAMVLAFKARVATKDVDAIFHPTQSIRAAAREVQEELALPDNWLNDGAKGFISTQHEVNDQDLPQFENLRVTAPTAEYMLAMKCMASRIPGQPGDHGDVDDIKFLVKQLRLGTVEAVNSVVEKYYPAAQIPIRAKYLIEDVIAELNR
ncbi:MAG: hypothetical protein AB1705_01005 [Verrucomicrobiota bacterium]